MEAAVVTKQARQPAIELRHLSMTFTRSDGSVVNAVRDVSMIFEEGEFTCIIGPSGHGKTTLLHVTAGLLKPTSGEVLVAGKRVSEPGPDRGVVFQKDSVFPWMRAIDNVEYGPRCRGVNTEERRKTALSYLKAVGLEHVAHSWPRELSGGMLKRVAVATVFANDPRVLLLDEPFSALDYVTKRQLHRVLLKLWAGEGTDKRRTVMFVTHDVDEALSLADRVVVVKHGGIVEDLPIRQPRPRTDDDLARPEMLEAKHVLLRHLGIEEPSAEKAWI